MSWVILCLIDGFYSHDDNSNLNNCFLPPGIMVYILVENGNVLCGSLEVNREDHVTDITSLESSAAHWSQATRLKGIRGQHKALQ